MQSGYIHDFSIVTMFHESIASHKCVKSFICNISRYTKILGS